MMTSIHNAAIQQLLCDFPNVKANGFGAEIRRILGPDDAAYLPRIIPDAYAVHAEDQEVVAFEVEDTNPISAKKMDRYIDTAFLLDEAGWALGLIVIDRWGTRRTINILKLFCHRTVAESGLHGKTSSAADRKIVATALNDMRQGKSQPRH